MTDGKAMLIVISALIFWVWYEERKFQQTWSTTLSSNFVLTGPGGLNITQEQWWRAYLYTEKILPASAIADLPTQLKGGLEVTRAGL